MENLRLSDDELMAIECRHKEAVPYLGGGGRLSFRGKASAVVLGRRDRVCPETGGQSVMSAGALYPGESFRWVRGDGSALILMADGRLYRRAGTRGKPMLAKSLVSIDEADALAEAEGFRLRGEAPVLVNGHDRHVDPRLTPEQQAQVDARIEAHARRVQAELERLGFLRDED